MKTTFTLPVTKFLGCNVLLLKIFPPFFSLRIKTVFQIYFVEKKRNLNNTGNSVFQLTSSICSTFQGNSISADGVRGFLYYSLWGNQIQRRGACLQVIRCYLSTRRLFRSPSCPENCIYNYP